MVWRVGAATPDLFAQGRDAAASPPGREIAPRDVSVPRRFVELARHVVCHRDSARFGLLYAMLWRIDRGERTLLDAAADPQVRRAETMAQAVRRDMHKMKAFVRFREVSHEDGVFYVAWFEPDHHIVAATAPFFAERFAAMRWSILTPEASAHWDLATLTFGPGAAKSAVPGADALEAHWRTYYASIFNPARLNTRAMKAQMPMKYWKNLPEAALIEPLTRQAGGRAEANGTGEGQPVTDGGWDKLKGDAASCRRCPLWEPATQTVFGEGPPDAPLMLVGEQPGEREDLAGRPFVGPAGAVLDRALAEAGIDRSSAYVTNAVKHFKFIVRGTRRLHQKPNVFEIETCRFWLDAEIAAGAPALIVALGATAGRGVFGRDVKIGRERGRLVDLREGLRALLTVHPSYLLRLPDEESKQREYARFVADLTLAREALGR